MSDISSFRDRAGSLHQWARSFRAPQTVVFPELRDTLGLGSLDWGDAGVVFLPLLPRSLATRTSVTEAEVGQAAQASEGEIKRPTH